MTSFIIKRILLIIPIMFVVSFLVFSVLRLGPVDPAQAYLLNSRIPPTEEALKVTRAELGLDKPFFTQYAIWLKGAVTLDFGKSYMTKRDALGDLIYYFPTTLKITFLAMIMVIIVSIPLGILGAVKKDSIADKLVKLFSFIGVSTPSFWFGFLLVYLFALKLNILPPFGFDGISSYIMPILTLGLMSSAINIRITRTSFLEHINGRSAKYLKVHGVSEKTIMSKYVLKNSMIPVVTSLGMHFGELIGGAVVVEVLFALPGVGRYVVSSITNHDYPVIQCFMILMTAVFIIVNLIIDIIYVYLNPKIKYGSII